MEEVRQMEQTKPETSLMVMGEVFAYEVMTNYAELKILEQMNIRAEKYPEKFPKVSIAEMVYEKITDAGFIKSLGAENYATGKYGLKDDESDDERENGYQEQGAIGEYLAACVIQDLGLEIEVFDKAYHGIDLIAIGKDSNGQYVIVEAKLSSSRNGKADLSTINKNSNTADEQPQKQQSYKQLSEDWIKTKLSEMEGKGSNGINNSQYSKHNAELASKMREALSSGNVKSLLVHTNVNTLNIIVQEHDGKKDWNPIAGYRFDKFA